VILSDLATVSTTQHRTASLRPLSCIL